MALHDPVEDALNARKAAARRVEAGPALSDDTLNVTNQFLSGGAGGRIASTFGPPERQFVGGTGGRTIPPTQPPLVQPVADGGRAIPPAQPPLRQFVGPSGRGLPSQASAQARSRFGGQQGAVRRRPGGAQNIPAFEGRSLADRFLNLPEPVSFSRTPQGRRLMDRILGLRGVR